MTNKMFKLAITMGNDAMTSTTHVADALEAVARALDKIDAGRAGRPVLVDFSDRVLDANGNSVGEFSFETVSCPDGGTCHHNCKPSACSRVIGCSPLSDGPVDVVRARGDGHLSVKLDGLEGLSELERDIFAAAFVGQLAARGTTSVAPGTPDAAASDVQQATRAYECAMNAVLWYRKVRP